MQIIYTPGPKDSVSIPPRYQPGDYTAYYLPSELRAFGLSWSEIERDAMTNKVLWS